LESLLCGGRMLTLQSYGGRKLERVFCANIANEAELEKFVKELREELKDENVKVCPKAISCEIWRETKEKR